MPVTSSLYVPSTCTVVTEATEHRDGLHVKAAKSPRQQVALKLLVTHPATPVMVHDSESAMLVTPVTHMHKHTRLSPKTR